MSETPNESAETEVEEFEVVELEADDGQIEEFVIIDQFKIEGNEYVLMALLEDMENMDQMSEQEFKDTYNNEDIFILMKIEDEQYVELEEEEFKAINPALEEIFAERSKND